MRLLGKAVVLSWCSVVVTCAFAALHAADRDPLQWTAMGMFVAAAAVSGLLNFFYSVLKTIPRSGDRR